MNSLSRVGEIFFTTALATSPVDEGILSLSDLVPLKNADVSKAMLEA
jgi:hypothetical protein